MKSRFTRLPGEPSIGDEVLQGAYEFGLRICKFREDEIVISYEVKGELLATGEVADSFNDTPGRNKSPATAKRQIAELIAAVLDGDEGRAKA
jgi:hypothetical protein